MRGKAASGAAGMFFEHAGIRPDRADMDMLHRFTGAFSAIPYENLTKLLARSAPGDAPHRLPATVVREHLEKGAGGTCFSLTETAREILSVSGFGARPVMADMQHGRHVHCALLVTTPAGESCLVDPGYLVPEPVLLRPGTETLVSCGGETLVYRNSPCGGSWDMFTESGSTRTWRYRIGLAHVAPAEFRGYWTESFRAPGMNSLHVSMRAGGCRLYAHNHNLRVVSETSGRRNEKLREDYPGRIAGIFGIDQGIVARALEELERSKRPERADVTVR